MRAQLLLIPLLLVAGCTGGGGSKGAVPTPTEENPCLGDPPAPGCITTSPTTAPTAVPYPADAGRISPLPVPDKLLGEVARKDNNLTPGVRTITFAITVPAGKVIGSTVICQGRGHVVVTTKPASDAEQDISCDGNAIPSQLGVFASDPVKVTTRYVFTLRATGPSRWLIAAQARPPQ
ncbi:MAG: hypothetical protein JWO22_1296 [Frankiales bacterium]|nr:hypothetical protein [Frankiales bacterium]